MNRTDISNLSTTKGRAIYQSYWRELMVEQHGRLVPSFWLLWRMAVSGTQLRMVSVEDVTYKIGHPLGLRAGTRLFMEEVVVRHYFNNVQALVYLGATILLVFLGLRFAGILSEVAALVGIGIEAVMLLILFVVLFYTPEEPTNKSDAVVSTQAVDTEEPQQVILEVLKEIEQIGSSYASLGRRLEQSAEAQERQLSVLTQHVASISGLQDLRSHTELLHTTNDLLQQLTASIQDMNRRVEMLFGKEIEFHVRREMESILSRGLNGEDSATAHALRSSDKEMDR